MYLENWRAWDETRKQLSERDLRRFHLFAGGRHYGAYGRYYGARIALDSDADLDQGIIVKWMDVAFDYFDRVLLDLYWRAALGLPQPGSAPLDAAEVGTQFVAPVLIERLSYDYPAGWEGRYAVIAEGAIQGAYTHVREAHSRVESLKGVGDVFIAPVGPPRLEGGWYIRVVEAFYRREEGA